MADTTPIGTLELMVMLAIMRSGEESYGVPISRVIEEVTGREVTLGSVYAALGRLEKKGLVKARLGEATPERGGRAKKYFRVTGKGIRELRSAQVSFVNLWQGLPQFS